MFSSYTTLYVLTCISYILAYNIAYDIVFDIVWQRRMRCSFDWIWSWIQGVQIACMIAQAQEFAWQCIHSGIDHPTSCRRSRAIAADLGSDGRGSSRSGGRGSRFLLSFIPRHGEALGVNGKREW
jgi:hypothetical protein